MRPTASTASDQSGLTFEREELLHRSHDLIVKCEVYGNQEELNKDTQVQYYCLDAMPTRLGQRHPFSPSSIADSVGQNVGRVGVQMPTLHSRFRHDKLNCYVLIECRCIFLSFSSVVSLESEVFSCSHIVPLIITMSSTQVQASVLHGAKDLRIVSLVHVFCILISKNLQGGC